jgi:hypothetical protein
MTPALRSKVIYKRNLLGNHPLRYKDTINRYTAL